MRPHSARRPAFTLLEALLSISLTAMAGSALLLGLSAGMQATDFVLEQSVSAAIAEQLMDEISGKRYCEVASQPYETTLGPSSYEKGGTGRERFNDIDDFHGYSAKPPRDVYGYSLGTEDGRGSTRGLPLQASQSFLKDMRETVEVFYVSNTDYKTRLATGQTSDYRAIEVRIYFDDPKTGAARQSGVARRVVANVPTP